MSFLPFSPVGDTVSVTASGSSQSVALPSDAGYANVCRVVVSGAGVVAVKFGATATTSDMPLLGNTIELFARGAATTLHVIAISGTPVVYATVGIGA